MADLAHREITEQIIGAAYEVYNHLGYGFLEKVYRKAMVVELGLRGVAVEEHVPIEVKYKNFSVGNYEADLFVENRIIVELKVAKEYQTQDESQLLNELKAIAIKVGLLINFGKTKVEFKRLVF